MALASDVSNPKVRHCGNTLSASLTVEIDSQEDPCIFDGRPLRPLVVVPQQHHGPVRTQTTPCCVKSPVARINHSCRTARTAQLEVGCSPPFSTPFGSTLLFNTPFGCRSSIQCVDHCFVHLVPELSAKSTHRTASFRPFCVSTRQKAGRILTLHEGQHTERHSFVRMLCRSRTGVKQTMGSNPRRRPNVEGGDDRMLKVTRLRDITALC